MSQISPFQRTTIAYDTPVLHNLHASLRHKDRRRIAESKHQLLTAALGSIKAQDRAIRRSLKSEYITKGQYHHAADELNAELSSVTKLLSRDVDPEQIKMMWKAADKTSYYDSVCSVLSNVLKATVMEIGPGDGRKKHRHLYARLRDEMLKHYDAEKTDDQYLHEKLMEGVTHIWCPVLHQFGHNSNNRVHRKLAHIIPVSLGEQNLCALLGYEPDSKQLHSASNLLFLDHKIEEQFDFGRITFIPTTSLEDSSSNASMDYKVVIVDANLMKETVNPFLKWADLDGRQLQFRNDERPAKRNLYLHNLLAYMRSQLCEWKGHELVSQKLFAYKYSYATPDAFLRSDMLRWMSEKIATDLPQDWYMHNLRDPAHATGYRPSPEYLRRRAHSVGDRLRAQCSRNEYQGLVLEPLDFENSAEDSGTSDSEAEYW